MLIHITNAILEINASKVGCAMATNDQLKPKHARQILDDLQNLQSLPSYAGTVQPERFVLLDTIVGVALGQNPSVLKFANDPMVVGGLDVNAMLRYANHWFDDVDQAFSLEGYGEQVAALDKSFAAFEDTLQNPSSELMQFLDIQLRGRVALSLPTANLILSILYPNFELVLKNDTKARTYHDLEILALALHIYHAEHGRYPDTLQALTPDPLPTIPQDRFTGDPLIYQPTNAGYLLYSVGPNIKDDGSENDIPRSDDLAISMPLRIPERQE